MPKPELKGRAFSLYARCDEDLAKWKKLCPSSMKLNAFLLELIEKGIDVLEKRSTPRIIDTEELNKLRKENESLIKELQFATAKLEEMKIRELNYIQERSKGHDSNLLENQLIDILKKGEIIGSNSLNYLPGRVSLYPTNLIRRALKDLEAKGLIQLTHRGWKWIKT